MEPPVDKYHSVWWGSAHEVPPTPATSSTAEERPPDAQEAKAAEATTVMAMQLTLFI